MESCLELCYEMIKLIETKLNEAKKNNENKEILSLYEDLLFETYRFTGEKLEEFI